MRLVAFSDIHGNQVAFDALRADLERIGGWDQLWVLGDIAAFGGRPAECIRGVKAFVDQAESENKKGSVRVIRGNTDRYLINGSRHKVKPAENEEQFEKIRAKIVRDDKALQWGMAQLSFDDYDFLRKLGGECDFTIPDYGTVIGYHAIPGDDEGDLQPDTSDEEAADALLDREGRLGIGGHVHVQMDRQLTTSAWRAINIGSVGMSNDKPGYVEYGVFTFENGDVQVELRAIPYDVDAAVQDVLDSKFPNPDWLINIYRNGQK